MTLTEIAQSRLIHQYRDKPALVDWVSINPSTADADLITAAARIENMYNIDDANTAELDIIGRVVGIDRGFTSPVDLQVSVFDELDGGEFGDDEAIFSELNIASDQVMSNELFRLALRAKIAKNYSDATIDSILELLNFLIPGADFIRLTDNLDMSFSVEFYGHITELERWALVNADLVPVPQGVMFNGFLEGYNYSEFGDIDAEFGDEDAEFVGFTGV